MLRRVVFPATPADPATQPRNLLGPAPADAPDAFEGALLDTATHAAQTGGLVDFSHFYAAVVASILAIPMLFSQSVDLTRYETTYLAAPPVPFAPPPPPAAAGCSSGPAQTGD